MPHCTAFSFLGTSDVKYFPTFGKEIKERDIWYDIVYLFIDLAFALFWISFANERNELLFVTPTVRSLQFGNI